MKITTRIILGYGLLIAVLAGLVVCQVITINRMQSINRRLSGSSFQNGLACLQALRDRDLVEENISKSFATAGNPDNLKKLQESHMAFETSLSEIKTYAKSAEELAEIKRLSQLWDSYLAEQAPLLEHLSKSETVPPQSLQNDLEQLRAQTLSVYQASLRSMSSEVEKSRKTGETAVLVLICAALVALATGILVAFLIFHSISKPLAHLTEGARAIAEGKFLYRLDTSRNDELSQLARDFNTLTDRLKELD
jgi:two-component system, NtrC family, sensor histidine kinase KinB